MAVELMRSTVSSYAACRHAVRALCISGLDANNERRRQSPWVTTISQLALIRASAEWAPATNELAAISWCTQHWWNWYTAGAKPARLHSRASDEAVPWRRHCTHASQQWQRLCSGQAAFWRPLPVYSMCLMTAESCTERSHNMRGD